MNDSPQYAVEVIKHSTSPWPGARSIATLALTYPRAFIHEQFLTHRALSRNAESSRAKPIEKVVEQVRKNPASPIRWGVNGKGMDDHGEMTADDAAWHQREWMALRDQSIKTVNRMIGTTGRPAPHKQITNRLLGPWQLIRVVTTATDWDNFLALRCEDGQPEIKHLARMIRSALATSKPTVLQAHEWHLPFIHDWERAEALMATDVSLEDIYGRLCRISAARCARVSYVGHDGKPVAQEKDLALFETLVNAGRMHASPMEHQARPDPYRIIANSAGKVERIYDEPELHGNFTGWVQFRQTIPNHTITRYTWKGN